MIKAIAVDDEPPALEILKHFSNQCDDIDLLKTFYNTDEALAFLNKNNTDLVFLDINMPSISGLEFRKKIRHDIKIIFTTAYTEYAVDAFDLNAIDYLLKPFTIERFEQAVVKVKASLQNGSRNESSKADHILVRVDYALVKIMFNDILFIEGLDDYLKIHLADQKPIIARMTMKSMSEKLPPKDFIRVHRSYVVPLAKIESVRNKVISIAGEEVPVGSSYEANFNLAFKK